MFISAIGHNLKCTIGGFFMALHRIVLIKIPNIGRNVKTSRKIMNHFLVMEVMIIFMLLGICLVGNLMSGTGLVLAFCQGYSTTMGQILHESTGASLWTMLGKYHRI